jgi:hypothetical protein
VREQHLDDVRCRAISARQEHCDQLRCVGNLRAHAHNVTRAHSIYQTYTNRSDSELRLDGGVDEPADFSYLPTDTARVGDVADACVSAEAIGVPVDAAGAAGVVAFVVVVVGVAAGVDVDCVVACTACPRGERGVGGAESLSSMSCASDLVSLLLRTFCRRRAVVDAPAAASALAVAAAADGDDLPSSSSDVPSSLGVAPPPVLLSRRRSVDDGEPLLGVATGDAPFSAALVLTRRSS